MSEGGEEFEGDLRTTYVSNIGSGVQPRDADLVLGVIRYKYDFVERTVDRNCPALAPLEDLLQRYKTVEEAAESDGVPDPSRAAWDAVDVRERYLDYVDTQPGPQICIEDIRERLDDGQTVWLVCLEKDDTFCHRRLLAARIRGSSPTHWSELHEPPEPDNEEDDESGLATLGDFTGGETA